MEEQTSKYQCTVCEKVYAEKDTAFYLMDVDLRCHDCMMKILYDHIILDITHPDYDIYKVFTKEKNDEQSKNKHQTS